MGDKELQVVVLGSVDASLVAALEEPLARILGIQSYVSKATLPKPAYAFNKTRNQYNAAAIIKRLSTVRENGAPYILAVTDFDIFEPDLPFVYGEANREAKGAVISVHRIRGDATLMKKRVCTEVVHQVGHMIGLSLCEDTRCAMFSASNSPDTERRNLNLCANCKNEFAKLRRGEPASAPAAPVPSR